MTTLLLLLYGFVAAAWVSLVILTVPPAKTLSEILQLVALLAAGLIWPAALLFAAGLYLMGRRTM